MLCYSCLARGPRARADIPKRCSQCDEIVANVHEVSEHRVRDLPLREGDTWLVFPRARTRACSKASTVKINVIKRVAYGYRDDACFLIIVRIVRIVRVAFPGIPGRLERQ